MAGVLFVVWDGGGTVAPALGVARRLADRGHDVRVLGSRWLGTAVAATGARFVPFDRTPEPDPAPGRAIEDELGAYFDLWFGLTTCGDLESVLADEPADVLVIDCMFANLVAFAERRGVPAVVLAHLFYQPAVDGRWLDGWTWAIDALNDVRSELGLDSFTTDRSLWGQAWSRAQRVLVATLDTFDYPAAHRHDNVRYVGPIRDEPEGTGLYALPDELAGTDPLVLLSLSSSYQHQEAVLERAMQALSALPVRTLVTVGRGMRVDDVRSVGGAVVRQWVSHEAVLPHASLVVTHGGHGTTMAALAAGVPLVCLPMGRDQHLVADRVAACGVGSVVAADASVADIRDAIMQALASPDHRDAAARVSGEIAALGAGRVAVEEIEAAVASGTS